MRRTLVPRILPFVSALVLLSATPVRAQEPESRFGLATTYGSSGLGGSVSYGLAPRFHLRLDGQGLGAPVTNGGDRVEWSAAGLVDWFPASIPLRVSGGMGWVSQQVNDNGFQHSDNNGATYLGLGWGNVLDRKGRFSFVVDAGSFYRFGVMTSSLSSSGAAARRPSDVPAPNGTSLHVQSRFIPVVSAGVGIRF